LYRNGPAGLNRVIYAAGLNREGALQGCRLARRRQANEVTPSDSSENSAASTHPRPHRRRTGLEFDCGVPIVTTAKGTFTVMYSGGPEERVRAERATAG
jgi:hypothetical protein